ncbi:MAG: hypothetical protein IIB05_11770 [Bacteroidetes bacterium]|nr:hypothetical protein [Bacteroidota bacterium]
MRKLLTIILILLFTSINDRVISQQKGEVSSIPQEITIDNTKQFWITSKKVAGQQYLIKVLLPRNYFQSDTSTYPVFYVTDSDILFLTACQNAYSLRRSKVDIIVIGISYGSEEKWGELRGRDFSPYPNDDYIIGAEHFLAFIRDELIPEVESKFRIDKSDRTLFGFSAGSRFALYVLFNHPELFKNYLVLGTPLANRNLWAFRMEEEYYQKRKDLPARLYLATGEYDGLYQLLPEFAQILEKRKYKKFQFRWETLKEKKHDYKAVAEGMANGLQYIYQIEPIFDTLIRIINEHGIEKAISEYYRLKRTFLNDYIFNESELNNLGYYLLNFNRIKESIEIFRLNAEAYPDSWNVYDSLGEAYTKNGDNELAIINYRKSLDLNPQNTDAVEIIKKLQSK